MLLNPIASHCTMVKINSPRSLFILKEKKCQTIPPGTLNVFYILVIHTDNAQVSFVLIAHSVLLPDKMST